MTFSLTAPDLVLIGIYEISYMAATGPFPKYLQKCSSVDYRLGRCAHMSDRFCTFLGGVKYAIEEPASILKKASVSLALPYPHIHADSPDCQRPGKLRSKGSRIRCRSNMMSSLASAIDFVLEPEPWELEKTSSLEELEISFSNVPHMFCAKVDQKRWPQLKLRACEGECPMQDKREACWDICE